MPLRDDLQRSLGSAYTLDRELGGGGMSRVFVARDEALRRDVVVKVLPPELVAGVNVERFRREILVAAGLQHPHIVPVHSSGETDGLPWFVMPFVKGESLRERVARGPLPISECLDILREVAKALSYAHEQGVVHRDIKPDNVLLTGGTAVVTDFGIAKALSASRTVDAATDTRGSLTQVGMSIGTPMYMAPEQAAADPDTDARADIYAFGCVAYEMLAGRPPFTGMTPQKLLAAHMGERPRNIADLRRDTPPALAELVMRCLEKDPDHRPRTSADVVRLLDAVSTTSSSGPATPAGLLGGRVRIPIALSAWGGVFVATWLIAKAAVIAIGLPGWVVPGALIIAALGLPAILLTAYVQRTAYAALTRTPTLTPGDTPAPQSTMATLALRASPHVTFRAATRAGAMIFGAFVLLVAVFMTLRALGIGPAGSLLAAGRINAKEPLLVTDFTVKRGDSTLAGVVSEAIRTSLSQSRAITLLPVTTVTGALERMQRPTSSRIDLALAREIGRREGVSAIVDGDITQLGSGYVVTVRLVSVDSGVALASVQKAVDGPKELVAAVDEIGRTLRGRIGESLRAVQRTPPLAQVTTASTEALRLYSQGSRAYTIDSDLPRAMQLLRQAVAIDTSFAAAWRLLGSVYVTARYPVSAVDSMIDRAYRFRSHLTASERQLAEASYFQRGSGRDRARASVMLERQLSTGDSNPTAMILLALNLITQRQFARAESLYRAVIRVEPTQLVYNNLATLLLNTADFAKAQRTIDTALTLFPSPAAYGRAMSEKDALYASQGNFEAAAQLADSILAHGDPVTRNLIAGGAPMFELVRGRITALRRRMGTAQTTSNASGTRRVSMADSITLSLVDVTTIDQRDRATQRMDASLAAMPLNTRPEIDRNYLDVATIYARAGHPEKAKAVLARRAAEVHDTAILRSQLPREHRVLGEIAVAENRPLDAVREFWKGDSLPDGPADACDACTYVSVARAYDNANVADSAIVYFEKYFASPYSLRMVTAVYSTRGPALRRLGELYEAKGERVKAAHYYQMFVDLWKNADAEVQPQVAEVRRRLARLGDGEKRGSAELPRRARP